MVAHFFSENRVLMVRPRPQMPAILYMPGATELRASRPLEDGLVCRWFTMLLKCLVDQVAIWSNGRGKARTGHVVSEAPRGASILILSYPPPFTFLLVRVLF